MANKKTKPKMELVETRGNTEIYSVSGFGGKDQADSANSAYPDNSSTIFDDDSANISYRDITVKGKTYTYVPFGADDQLPFEIIQKVGDNMVMSQNKFYNVLTCYGQGIRFYDKKTKLETENEDVQLFTFRNQLNRFYIEQCTDMKYFFFTVTCIILSADGKQIVQLRHKESCYCRFEKADEMGKIQHVLYGNWRDSALDPDKVEVLELLDEIDPWGDLNVRLGLMPDPKTGEKRKALASDPFGRATKTRKFAIVTRFPTPGYQYYPVPYYTAILRDAWYDIYMLIGRGKRAKIRNSAPPRFQVEVYKDYWDNLCDNEGITDPEKRKARIKKEKQNIENFISGNENIGKTWITGYYVEPASGKEVRMVRINDITAGKKEGGDWSDDVQEASNSLCYGDNIHPNLVGATPGKSAMNNSGSDKRELFLLKQANETAFHDILLQPFKVLLWFNGWQKDIGVDVPMIVLTTLDENKEKKTVTTDKDGGSDEEDNGDGNQ
jgi:hypothetical protein